MGQAESRGPAATPSPGTGLRQEPCRVQTNLGSPSPRLGLALKDSTSRLTNSSFRQQSNLHPLGDLPKGRVRECAVRQSNLSIRETNVAKCGSRASPHVWSEPQKSFWPRVMGRGSPPPRRPLPRSPSSPRRSQLSATDTPCPDFRPTVGRAPLNGHTRPGSRCGCGLGNWITRLTGEPLTLDDLAVPARTQARAPSQAAISQLLASVRHLEHEAAHLGCRLSQQEPWTSDGQAFPAGTQPSQSGLAYWDERKKHPRSLKGTSDWPEMPGVQADLRWQLLSRCFRAWQHLAWRRRAVAAALALGHRQLLRRGLQALRWTLRLRDAQLKVAWRRHTQALLARSFQKVRVSRLGRGAGVGGSDEMMECFGAWQQLAKRGTGSQHHQADHQAGPLRLCLRRWVGMKQLQASDGAKVTQLSLCQQKAGNMVLHSSDSGRATAHGLVMVAQALGLPQEQGHGSLQKGGGRLALHRALLLWRRQLSLCQRATTLLGWSHWATAHRARRELAARWAWDRSCRATLGIWRQRLEQWQEAEQRAGERGQRLVRDALCRWRACWHRQQFLQGQYQRWVQVHLQGLRRAAFRGWQQVAARRRHTVARSEQLLLQSHFQAWRGLARRARTLQAQQQAFQDGLRRWALGAAFAMWRKGRVATARAREQRMARASIAHWRSHVQGRRVDKQQRRAQAQQAFVAWREALGRYCKARQPPEERAQAQAQAQVALCWTLWVRESRLHRLSQAHAARKLSARVLEAWARSAAQGRVQRVAIAQFQQAGLRLLLQTYWAQWRTALLRVWLEPRVEEASTAHPRPKAHLRHQPGLAGKGHLLVLMDAAAPWKLWLQRPGSASWTQGWPPTAPGEDRTSETSALKAQGQVDKRQLGPLRSGTRAGQPGVREGELPAVRDPLSKAGIRSPDSRLQAARAPACERARGGTEGPGVAVTCSHGKKNRSEPGLPKEGTMPHVPGTAGCQAVGCSPTAW
ncbi:hypothetical protein PAL_GLEAN10012990 [Pteropus alecto]|uniref:Uncharacterized protein n=1 Tax=Pteropus alecto TaxID=9402 RepID=L5KJ19_PTEAL|nr:hypothetical protein PAL_GLEAN10012990 [Pteropus alecto]